MKLITPTLDDLRSNFPKPEGISGPVNKVHGAIPVEEGVHYNHGWIATNGTFFICDYGGHDVFADNLMKYYPEMVEENFPKYLNYNSYEDDLKGKDTSFKTYDQINAIYCEKYPYLKSQGMNSADYLVSQGWMKWMYRQYKHEILVSSSHEILTCQWMRIGWLDIHSTTPKYEIVKVDVI